jgi:glycosyltransferase involved in cell wall biosynthesis
LFCKSEIFISLSTHDGTPNSLLEAMACGCFPITGDIESLREWIIPGVNGLLVEPSKPQTVAEAVLLSLKNSEWRSQAADYNRRLIRQRADIDLVRAQMQVFFERFMP